VLRQSHESQKSFRLTLICLLSVIGLLGQSVGTANAATAHTSAPQRERHSGQQVVGYFTQWGIYSSFFEKNLLANGTAAHLTTIDYAFSNISANLQCSQGMSGLITSVRSRPVTAWYYDGTNFWSYDDPASIGLKMDYVQALGLGGVMAWSLDGDDASGTLMNAVYQGLRHF
jgi:GH18 family chitinase